MIRVVASEEDLEDFADRLGAVLKTSPLKGILTLTSAIETSELTSSAHKAFAVPTVADTTIGVGLVVPEQFDASALPRAKLALCAVTEEAALRHAPAGRTAALMFATGCDIPSDVLPAIEFLWANNSVTGQVLHITPSGNS